MPMEAMIDEQDREMLLMARDVFVMVARTVNAESAYTVSGVTANSMANPAVVTLVADGTMTSSPSGADRRLQPVVAGTTANTMSILNGMKRTGTSLGLS
jgi:hypothetical protein